MSNESLVTVTCQKCFKEKAINAACSYCYPVDIKTGLDFKNPLDIQVGGGHYKDFKIQPIEFCHHNKLGPCETSIVKYICRHKEKAGRKDLEKARHYIDLLLELEYKEVISSDIVPSNDTKHIGPLLNTTYYNTTTAAHLIRDGSDA